MGIYGDVDHDNVEQVRIYILSKNKTGDKQRVCMRNSHAPHHKKALLSSEEEALHSPQFSLVKHTELNVDVEIRYVAQHLVRLIQRLLGSMRWRTP